MKALKILLIFVFAALLAFAVPTTVAARGFASADSATYVEITGNDAVFVFSAGRKQINLFTLPSTYFATLVSAEDDTVPYYIVNYAGLVGSVDVTTAVASPAANATVDSVGCAPSISLTLATDATMSVFDQTSGSFSDVPVAVADNLTFSYLGTTEVENENRLFVKASNGSFGSIALSAFSAYTLPSHKVTLDRLEQEAAAAATLAEGDSEENPGSVTADDGNDAEATQNNTLRIILIVGITIPSLLIVFLLFKPQGCKKKSAAEQRNRHYDSAPRYNEDYDERYSAPRRDSESYGRNYRDRYDD